MVPSSLDDHLRRGICGKNLLEDAAMPNDKDRPQITLSSNSNEPPDPVPRSANGNFLRRNTRNTLLIAII
jgi:hypothetical protein